MSWASDGSIVLVVSGLGDIKSITAVLMGPRTLVLQVAGRNTSILHEELMGLVMGLLLTYGHYIS
jgi:hypothetical protein